MRKANRNGERVMPKRPAAGKFKPAEAGIEKAIAELAGAQDQQMLARWAADCAEHVLPLFEAKYPRDKRPRTAIEAARAWVRGEIKVGEARTAALGTHAAARKAEHAAARAAARSAGHAAGTAHMAGHAVHAATYAALAAASAVDASEEHAIYMAEREWQSRQLRELTGNL